MVFSLSQLKGPEKPQSFGSLLGEKLGGGFSQGIGKQLSQANDLEQLREEYRLKKELEASKLKGEKSQEKVKSMQTALGTIKEMRNYISSAGPSNYIQSFFGGETTKNRAQLEQLGKSLIPLVAAGVPIRNQREFEEYKKVITNPNSLQAELEGALNGIEGLLTRSLEQSGQGVDEEELLEEEPASEAKETSKKVKVINPKTGKPVYVTKDQLKQAIAAGGKVVK